MNAYTVEEVARLWQVTPHTVYTLLRQGRLEGFRIGRAWRVTPEAMTAYIEGGKAKTKGYALRRKNISYIT